MYLNKFKCKTSAQNSPSTTSRKNLKALSIGGKNAF